VGGAGGRAAARPDVLQCGGSYPRRSGPAGQGRSPGFGAALHDVGHRLSLPEAIILRKVHTIKLILAFFSVVALGILIVGYLFNLIM
jgi:hypothetical protein